MGRSTVDLVLPSLFLVTHGYFQFWVSLLPLPPLVTPLAKCCLIRLYPIPIIHAQSFIHLFCSPAVLLSSNPLAVLLLQPLVLALFTL